MSFRLLQFAPQARTLSMRVPVRWMGLDGNMGANGFLSSWLDGDGDNDREKPRRRINWGAIAGLAVSFVISGGFWTGIGVLVARALN